MAGKIKSFLMLFLILIIPSPFLYSIGLQVRYASLLIMLISCIWFVLINVKKNEFKITPLFLFFFFNTIVLGFFTALHYVVYYYVIILSALIAYFMFFNLLDEEDINQFIETGSIFIFILEIGAIIGFVYVLLGGDKIFAIKNPDGRENAFYLTTFSNARIGKFIRPSGIYDEPGAFSFFIIALCSMRIYLKKNPVFTIVLLFCGVITMSLTHILCTSVLIIPLRKQFSKKQRIVFDFTMIFLLIVFLYLFFDIFDRLIFSRLRIDKTTGKLAGDNRSSQIKGCIQSIKDNGFLYGNYELSLTEIASRYGVIGENPLSLLAINGLFNSVPYYSFLLVLCFSLFSKEKWVFLSVLLLFLQRPYQSQLGYSFFFVLFFDLAVFEIKKTIQRNYKILLG